jgi:hypothetical protein
MAIFLRRNKIMGFKIGSKLGLPGFPGKSASNCYQALKVIQEEER